MPRYGLGTRRPAPRRTPDPDLGDLPRVTRPESQLPKWFIVKAVAGRFTRLELKEVTTMLGIKTNDA